jgi:hypothetical protein
LIVDTDAVLTFPISAQPFQPVTRRHGQVFQRQSGVQDVQLFQPLPVQLGWQSPASACRPKPFGISIPEPSDHVL